MKGRLRCGLRISIFALCFTLFVLQSYQEFLKFTSGVTSTALSTITDKSLGYPTISVCAETPYRAQGRITTMEQFRAMTFNAGELVSSMKPPMEQFNVSKLYTYHNGLCLLLRPPENLNYTSWITLRTRIPVKLSLLSEGQEFCLVMAECNHEIRTIVARFPQSVVRIRALQKALSKKYNSTKWAFS